MRYYLIYQLPHNSDNLFRSLRETEAVDLGDYCCVWADDIEVDLNDEVDRTSYCEDLFMKFNCKHPKGFGGHSMSVSDIIMLHDEDQTDFYYCDSIGFKKVEAFRN